MSRFMFRSLSRGIIIGGVVSCVINTASADQIKNPVAVFAGLDKITGRIVSFEVSVGETVQFGTLQMTPRVCYTRPATEEPNTTAFLEADEITLDSKRKRIFTGWMFAASPGLHGIEHPIYDIWLTDCKGGTEVIKSAPKAEASEGTEEDGAVEPAPQNIAPQQYRNRVEPSPDDEDNPREIIPEDSDILYDGQE